MTATLPRKMDCEPSQRKLKVCVVYSRLPFPMMRGDQLTVAHLLSYLKARGHSVDFFTLDTGGEMNQEQSDWLEKTCNRTAVFPHGPFAVLQGVLTALVMGQPLQVGYFRNKHLLRAVRDAISHGSYDVIYCYYLRSAPTIPPMFSPNKLTKISGRKATAFLALQLSQTLNTRRIYEHETSRLKKLFYWLEWQRVRRYEARIWRNFTRTVLIGSRDVDDVRQACRLSKRPEIDNWVLGAHGTDVQKFRMASDLEVVEGRVVFSGSMRYQPNVQAILWFVQNCWQRIRREIPGAHLFVVGQSPAVAVAALDGRDGIEVTGTVPDVGEFIRSASVCINPMLAAGGMQNKLIEYMACGKAVVATSVANEGIGAPLDALQIADRASAFTEATIELLFDNEKATLLGRRARAYVAKEWTWEYQFDRLEEEFYNSLDQCGSSE